jgi:Fic family protein
LALIHYQFEAIHPFLDGNGRIGRLLVTLLVVHWGLLPYPVLHLSAYLERHRAQYYELLERVSSSGAWVEWVSFFLDGVARQSSSAAALILALRDLQEDWRRAITEPGASGLSIQLMESLFESPILTIPQAASRLGVTYPSAKRHVDRLVRLGILEQSPGRTSPKYFSAKQILEILGRES